MSRYKVARYVSRFEIETQPGSYFWKRTAHKAADLLNAANAEKKNAFAAFVTPGGLWEAWPEAVLERAVEYAKELKWQQEDREARDKRTAAYIRSLDKHPSGLDNVKAGHPATVNVSDLPVNGQIVHWLDEDATGSVPAATENYWVTANGGSLDTLSDITPEQAAGIGCWPPLEDDLPTRTPGATVLSEDTLTPDETLDVLDEATFTPRYAEPEDLLYTSDAEHAVIMQANGDAITTPGPDRAAQVEEFLADSSAGVKGKRPVRKRPAPKITKGEAGEAAATGGVVGFIDAAVDSALS